MSTCDVISMDYLGVGWEADVGGGSRKEEGIQEKQERKKRRHTFFLGLSLQHEAIEPIP